MPYDYQVHIDQTKYEQVSQRLQNAKNILILPHKGMDGDTLGSALALGLALDQIGKKYTIASTDEEIGSVFGYMPKTDQIVDDFQETDFDTFVYIDHSEIYRTGFEKKHPHIEANIPNKIVIDHHQISKDLHCDDMLLDTQSPATAIIVYHLLRHMQIDIESDIATCLLTSIYTDTGGFMHNTTQEVWSLSGVLTDLGADQRSISKHIFQTKPIVQLKLWGLVLDRSYQNKHGILFSGITQEELDQAWATPEDLAGVISMLNSVNDAKFVVFAYEKFGWVKISMRTQRDDVNLSNIAKIFGGGGHIKAAGFFIPGKLHRRNYWEIKE